MQNVTVEVMSCYKCAFDIFLKDGPISDISASKPILNEHYNDQALMEYFWGN